MSNKTQLQTNNNNLDTLITRVNAATDIAASLPEASGGGSGDVETATVSVTSYRSDHCIYYTGVNEVITQSNFNSLTFTCIKPSVVYLETHGANINTTANIERPRSTYLFIIKGDGTITLTEPILGGE